MPVVAVLILNVQQNIQAAKGPCCQTENIDEGKTLIPEE